MAIFIHHEYDMNQPVPVPTGDYIYIQHDSQLQLLHNKIFHWSTSTELSDNLTIQYWCNSIDDKLNEHSSWNNIQALLNINAYKDNYTIIQAYAPLHQQYHVYLIDNE